MCKPEDVFTRNPDTAWRLIDGQAVIFTPDDSLLHTLNPVASKVWELLDGEHDLKSLVDAICEEFEVEREQATADVQEFISDLVNRGLAGSPEEAAPEG